MTANHILRWISSGAEDEDEDGDEDDEEKDEAGSPEGYEKEENKEEEEDEYDDVAKLELGEGEEEVGLSYLMRKFRMKMMMMTTYEKLVFEGRLATRC